MAADNTPELSSLKRLLFSEEHQHLAALQEDVAALDRRVGSDDDLTKSVAGVVAAALRRAEVKNHRELAASVSPLVVAAIRREIIESRDIMVEALYPITGRLVATSVTRAIQKLSQEINDRFDAMLSPQAVWMRLKAVLSGRSYGELLLAANSAFHLEQILLVNAQSGVFLASWPQTPGGNIDMISALLAAIMEFSREAFADSDGELRALNLGSQLLLLRRSPQFIVAAVGRGQVTPALEQQADEGFLRLLEQMAARGSSGDARIQDAVLSDLHERLSLVQPAAGRRRRISPALVVFGLLGLLAVAGASWSFWRNHQAEQRGERIKIIENLASLQGYPVHIVPDDALNRVLVSGLAPDADARALVQQKVSELLPERPVDMNVSLVPSAEALQKLRAAIAELQRVQNEILNVQRSTLASITGLDQKSLQRQSDVFAALDHRLAEQVQVLDGKLAAEMLSANQALQVQKGALGDLKSLMSDISARLQEASGVLQDVKSQTLGPEQKLAAWIQQNALFFDDIANYRDENVAKTTLGELAALMKAAPQVRLRVVGIADDLGATLSGNRHVARQRAERVALDLNALGVTDERLILVSRPSPPRISEIDGPGSPNRRVAFELALNGE